MIKYVMSYEGRERGFIEKKQTVLADSLYGFSLNIPTKVLTLFIYQ